MRNNEVLDRALAGRAAATPAVAELVELARELEDAWAAQPSAKATRRGLAQALDAFEGNGQVVAFRPRFSRGRRFVAGTAVAVAALVALPGIARAASDGALPGDILYPVKLGFENVRLALADDPAEEAAIQLALSDERLEEAVLSRVLGRRDAEQEALRRYTAAVLAFDADIGKARALGLDVAVLVSRADALLEQQNEILAALIGRPADPSVPGIQQAMEAVLKAKGHARTDHPGRGPDKDAKDEDAKHGKGKGKGKADGRPGWAGKGKKGNSAGERKGAQGQRPPDPKPQVPANSSSSAVSGGNDDGDDDDAELSGGTGLVPKSKRSKPRNGTWEQIVSDLVEGRTQPPGRSLPRVEG